MLDIDTTDILKRAFQAVEAAKLPAELRQVGFQEAVRLEAGTAEISPAKSTKSTNGGARRPQRKRRQPQVRAGSGGDTNDEATPATSIDSNVFFGKVSEGTDVDQDKLESVFYVEGGSPHVAVQGRRLGTTRRAQMTTVAQLICVARRSGLDETETSTRVVRDECMRLKVLDDKNINAYLSQLDGISYIGDQRNKRLRVLPAAEQNFAEVIRAVLGETSKSEA